MHIPDDLDHGRTRARLLAIITTVVVLWFLHWSAPATVPLAFALFVTMLLVPLVRLLERWLPRWLALIGAFAAMVAVLVAFGATVVWTAERLAEHSEGYVEQITAAVEDGRGWLEGHGLAVPDGGEGLLPGGSLSAAAQRVGRQILDTGTGVLLVVALALLALLEVDRLGAQIREGLPPQRAGRIVDLTGSMATQFQRYLVARTALGLLNGAVATVLAWIIGLDFAIVWGILTFALNYIPTIGSVVAVVPPHPVRAGAVRRLHHACRGTRGHGGIAAPAGQLRGSHGAGEVPCHPAVPRALCGGVLGLAVGHSRGLPGRAHHGGHRHRDGPLRRHSLDCTAAGSRTGRVDAGRCRRAGGLTPPQR